MTPLRLFSILTGVSALVALASRPAPAADFPVPGSTATVMSSVYSSVTTDLFDLQQGLTIISSSPITYNGADASRMFGAPGGIYGDQNNTLFGDGGIAGTVHTVVFSTPTAVTVRSIRIGFSQDGDLTRRGAAGYSLLGLQSSTDTGVVLSQATLAGDYVTAYGQANITVEDTFQPFTGSFFRFNVVQQADYFGPRVQELDGFASSIATPSTDVLVNIASGTQAQGAVGYPLLTPSNATSVTKTGNGTIVFDTANTYTGSTNVNQGTLLVSNSAALQATPITVQTGGRLSINAVGTMQAPSLTLTGSGQVILPIATRQVVSLGSLAIDQASGGKLDIGKGRVEIAPGGITEAELRADLIAGRGTGNFSSNNSGIVTSAENPSSLFVPVVGYRVFASGSAIVAWSAFGDANLDGQVNSTDISLINSSGKYGKAGSAAAWWQGDFNYDGIVNSTDISLINASGLYGTGSYLPPLPPAPLVLTSVPEPSTWVIALAGLTCAAWIASRRRGNR